MADVKIIRIIGTPSTDAVDAQNPSDEILEPTGAPVKEDEVAKFDKLKKGALVGGVVLAGKEAFNFATTSVERYTGDAKLQQNINFGLELVGYGALIAVNPVVGSISFIAKIGNDFAEHQYQRKWDDIEASVNRERLGRTVTGRSGRNINRR